MRSIEFKASFDKTYQKLSSLEKSKVTEAVDTLLGALEAGSIPTGLGLKRLQEDQWEIRVGLNLRVGFRMRKNAIEFGIVGSHDSIKKYLKNL